MLRHPDSLIEAFLQSLDEGGGDAFKVMILSHKGRQEPHNRGPGRKGYDTLVLQGS
jgi:hypothetical protein